MHALLISLAMIGQAEVGLPPAPAADESIVANDRMEEMKTWLLTRLIVDNSFDTQKSAEVERMLDTMNERQLRVLVSVYKERQAQREQQAKVQQSATQQQALDQAKLDKQQVEAHRDYLKREYDRRLLQGYMTQNLVAQNILNNQRGLCGLYSGYGALGGIVGYGPFGYGGYGYGGMGYGGLGFGGMGYGGFGYAPINYGGYGYGYGVPGYGTSMMYGVPY